MEWGSGVPVAVRYRACLKFIYWTGGNGGWMSKRSQTRRTQLKRFGGLFSSIAIAVSGCLSTPDQTATQATTEAPACGIDFNSTTMQEPETASPDSGTSTPASTDAVFQWELKGTRPYGYLGPSGSPGDVGSFESTTFMPKRAIANIEVFGGSFEAYEDLLLYIPGGVHSSDLAYYTENLSTAVMAGEIDHDAVAGFQREDWNREQIDSYHGFSIFAGDTDGNQGVVAVSNTGVIVDRHQYSKTGNRIVKEQIDIMRGETDSYLQASPDFEPIFEHLPQGLYTSVQPNRSMVDNAFRELGIVSYGETILLGSETQPATKRTVYAFETDSQKHLDRVKTHAEKQFSEIPYDNPTITAPSSRTVQFEEPIDISERFTY